MPSTQDNIVHRGEPSRSALRVASLRAVHQLLDEPIVLNDPVALTILGPQAEAALRADPFVLNDPLSRGLRAALVVRSRLAEDELARSVEAGVRQYVVLGAGLDTFAYRNIHAERGLRVFEVDHPATQAWKQQALQDAGIAIPPGTTFVPVDFERSTLAEGLRQAGLRADQPACFSWLGVVVYLTRDAIFDTLRFVASLPAGSVITFDYRVVPTLLNPIERAIGGFIAAQIAEQGEPWKSAFEPATFAAEVRALGFSEARDHAPDELNARYLARRKDGLRTGGGFRLLCARV